MIWLGRGDEKRSVLTWKHGDDYCTIGANIASVSACRIIIKLLKVKTRS